MSGNLSPGIAYIDCIFGAVDIASRCRRGCKAFSTAIDASYTIGVRLRVCLRQAAWYSYGLRSKLARLTEVLGFNGSWGEHTAYRGARFPKGLSDAFRPATKTKYPTQCCNDRCLQASLQRKHGHESQQNVHGWF